MILIKKKKADTPPVLLTTGAAEIAALKAMTGAQRIAYTYKSSLYGGKPVKTVLKKLQYDKCCFCEARVSHVSHGDVEHYRPKAGWVQQDGDALTKPGYYWMAFDFSNLFLSCQICNQVYKKNYFPLASPAKRVTSHAGKLSQETPLIIDPGGKTDPAKHLEFRKEVIAPKSGSKRGLETIKRTGLNRDEAIRDRFEYLKVYQVLAKVARGNSTEAPDARAQMKVAALPISMYSLMIRNNFPDLV